MLCGKEAERCIQEEIHYTAKFISSTHCRKTTQNSNIAGNLNSIIHHPYITDKDMIITINFNFSRKQQRGTMSISCNKKPEDEEGATGVQNNQHQDDDQNTTEKLT